MNQEERRSFLLQSLLAGQQNCRNAELPKNAEEQKRLLRGLLNLRMPQETSAEFLRIQDEYLQTELAQKGITEYKTLTPMAHGLYLWRGDITTLRCDAIVNAANSSLLGCFSPNHGCIDNAIHTFAGVQLRATCARLMAEQGHAEETGRAKITPAFNLPSRYILHTVGPIVSGLPTRRDCELLAGCYRSCLELAEKNSLQSVAFCCISTGEFHFPREKAAETAVRTVRGYLTETQSKLEVIFNVFQESDYEIYRRLLGPDQTAEKQARHG